MKNLFFLVILCCCIVASASLVNAIESTATKTLNKAIYDFLSDTSSSIGFNAIHQSYFGDNILHAPTTKCTNYTSWPTDSDVKADTTMASILSRKYILFGANSVANVPKRYNYTAIGANYGKCTGFEADIAASIAYRIGMQYAGTPFQAYFTNDTTVFGNLINDMGNLRFDFILSGMSIEGTATTPSGQTVARTDLIDFTCPYIKDGTGAIKGNLATTVSFNSLSDLNQKEINLCVQTGTSMETLAKKNFPNANITSFALGADPYTKTLNGDFCHAYLAPIINALYQVKLDATKLSYLGDVGTTSNVAVGVRKGVATPSVSNSKKSNASIATIQLIVAIISMISFMLL